MLGEGAQLCLDRWHGDLRRLHAEAARAADGDPGAEDGAVVRALSTLVQEFPGIGPAGADIFLREVQGVWPDVRPYLDDRALKAARAGGLPGSPDALAALVPDGDLPRLAAALVRSSLA